MKVTLTIAAVVLAGAVLDGVPALAQAVGSPGMAAQKDSVQAGVVHAGAAPLTGAAMGGTETRGPKLTNSLVKTVNGFALGAPIKVESVPSMGAPVGGFLRTDATPGARSPNVLNGFATPVKESAPVHSMPAPVAEDGSTAKGKQRIF